MTLDRWQKMHLGLSIALARESRKSLNRWLDAHGPTNRDATRKSCRANRRFWNKTKYKKLMNSGSLIGTGHL